MHEFAACEGICRERKLELVSGRDYDELVTAATVTRTRIQALRPIVAELAQAAPRPTDWSVLYASMRTQTLVALKAVGPSAREATGAASSTETTVVWRCPDCGGLEETQPCIGVCIWRPLDWVELGAFESERVRALREVELEQRLFGLLTRFARVRPRDGAWQRNWRAFQAQARLLLGQ